MTRPMFDPRIALAAALALGLAGCGDDPSSSLGPTDPGSTGSFSREIGFGDFQQAVIDGPVRVEIELVPGELVARLVQVEDSRKLMDEEEIEAEVTAITAGADDATLTLALGGLQVSFDRSARLEADHGDELSFDDLVSRIQDALAAGGQPFVEAKRPPAAEPQAPDDPTFVATRLELEDESDDAKIELNIDADNLVENETAPPDGFLAALGLMIELRVSEGVTKLEQEEMDDEDEIDEVEGLVESVDLENRTFTLADGTLIRIVEGTRIESASGDDEKLGTLEEVQGSLDAGLPVEAEVEGIVETSDPLVIVASEVEFELEDHADEGGDDHSGEG